MRLCLNMLIFTHNLGNWQIVKCRQRQTQTFEEVHVLGVLSARVFDADDVVGGLVALHAWVRVAAEPDEAVLAAEHQLSTVDDGHVESLAVRRDAVGHRVEAAVHTSRHVAAVRSTQSNRAVGQPVHAKQPRQRPAPHHHTRTALLPVLPAIGVVRIFSA